MIYNPNFKVVEFDHFKTRVGLPSFVLSASEWIEKTNTVGFVMKFILCICAISYRESDNLIFWGGGVKSHFSNSLPTPGKRKRNTTIYDLTFLFCAPR